jgi:electron transport complex protein RnfG
MKEMIKYGVTLAFICIIAAGLLAGVNALTKSKIISQALAEEGASLREVLPQAVSFEAVKSGDTVLYYKALDGEGKLMGVAFKASGKGYSSIIETMVGMLKDGTITAIKVISQNETPGLGTRVAEPEFTGQFENIKDLSGVSAITGATISSRAVINSVEKKAKEIMAKIKNE